MPSAIVVSAAEYYVVNTSDLSMAGSGAIAVSQAEAYALRDSLVNLDPTRAGTLQVVAAHELYVEDAA